LAAFAAAWTAGFAALYVILIRAQGNSPVWWVLVVLATTIAMLVLAAAGWRAKPMLVAASVLLGLFTILGSASIGLVLLPAVVAAVIALIRLADRPRFGTPSR
jgi:hypothetical protein